MNRNLFGLFAAGLAFTSSCAGNQPAPRPDSAARQRAALRPAASPRVSKPSPTAANATTKVTVKGWKLEVSLVPERSTFMLGEPIYMTYKVHNLSGVDLLIPEGGDYRNSLGRPNRYKVEIKPRGGKPLPLRRTGPSFGGISSQRQLPDGGNFTRELFLPNWAKITKPGVYEITCARPLGINPATPAGRKNFRVKGPVVIARARVTVTPTDPKRMGKLIGELGGLLLDKNSGHARKAGQAMAAIDDKRTIAHWIKALKTRGYSVKLQAIHALSKYRTNPALAGLKHCKTDPNNNIRQTCAHALASSPHPKAYAVLITMKNDRYASIRLTVLHALAKRPCRQTLKQIRAMLKDKSSMVVGEAKRYLKSCNAKRGMRGKP
jgi:HEAT repeats